MKSTAKQQWETSDFPILCKSCLGEDKYVRMTKENYGQDCKICLKPFTVFRWCPGKGMRFRRTEICQTCSRLKNTCQSCLLDLQYGLPVQIRDGILQVKETAPQNDANREYFLATNAAKLARNDATLIDYDKTDPAAKAILEQLAERQRNSKSVSERNTTHPCSFFAKGTCTRGNECPYRHVLSNEKGRSLKSYRDRYYGTDDPAALAILERNPELQDAINRESSIAAISKPEDRTIRSLFVMGIRDGLTAEDVSSHFKAETVKLVADGAAAIVTFKTRLDAEEAAEDNLGMVDVKGIRVKVTWAHNQTKNHQDRIIRQVSADSAGEKQLETQATEPTPINDDIDEGGKKIKLSFAKKMPPPPPTAAQKPDYLARHMGDFTGSK